MSTAVPTSTRYFAPPLTRIRWIPAIAAADLVPTYLEWDAGIDLSDEVADLAGWNISSEQLATPGLRKFTGSIPGRLTVDASSLTFYADLAGQDIRTVLTRDQNGFISIGDAGDDAADLIDIFPVRVAAIGKVRTVTGSNAHHLTIPFSITDEPAEDVAVPAAA